MLKPQKQLETVALSPDVVGQAHLRTDVRSQDLGSHRTSYHVALLSAAVIATALTTTGCEDSQPKAMPSAAAQERANKRFEEVRKEAAQPAALASAAKAEKPAWYSRARASVGETVADAEDAVKPAVEAVDHAAAEAVVRGILAGVPLAALLAIPGIAFSKAKQHLEMAFEGLVMSLAGAGLLVSEWPQQLDAIYRPGQFVGDTFFTYACLLIPGIIIAVAGALKAKEGPWKIAVGVGPSAALSVYTLGQIVDGMIMQPLISGSTLAAAVIVTLTLRFIYKTFFDGGGASAH